MASWVITHHELCLGDDCNRWDCASLPENLGQWREGFVIETDPVGEPDGSVEIEWSDGTRSILRPRRREPRETWEESVKRDGKCRDALCACQKIDPTEGN